MPTRTCETPKSAHGEAAATPAGVEFVPPAVRGCRRGAPRPPANSWHPSGMGMEPFGWTRWHGGNPEGFLKNLGPNAAENGQTPGVAPRRNLYAHEYQGLKPLATVTLSLRDFGNRIIS